MKLNKEEDNTMISKASRSPKEMLETENFFSARDIYSLNRSINGSSPSTQRKSTKTLSSEYEKTKDKMTKEKKKVEKEVGQLIENLKKV